MPVASRTLTSAERVLTVLHRGEPDRVPINYGANAGIDARLKQHFGLAKDDREGLLKALGVDIRGVGPAYTGPVLHQPIPNRRVDPHWGVRTRWIEHESGGYWDFCDFPLEHADEAAVAAWPMPDPDHYDYAGMRAYAGKIQGYAVYTGGAGTGDNMNSCGFLRNYEQVLLDLATEDPAGLLLMDRRNRQQLAVLERTLEAVGDLIQFVWLGEDLGTQIGPIISKEMFRKHIRPRLAAFVDIAKAYQKPVMIHCCGSSSWAFDDFIEMGISAVDTLQPEAKDMAPAYLKKRYGDRLAFHGCISTAGPVATGSVADTERNVRETLAVMMPGGGYCLAPTHALQDNSPTENVLAMYRVAKEAGVYR